MFNKYVHVAVGVFVAMGLAALFMLAMKVSNLSSMSDEDGYEVSARFENIGGLKVRSPVSIAGVRVGRVTDIRFDQATFEAVVKMNVGGSFNQIPTDTTASILTAGLLGEQYIGLEPGGEEDYLESGSEIKLTQSALVLEQLIGQFMYNEAAEGGE
ncbi:outer membrane lipid asymmetry maintenance protein MlaD [Solemya pervernicosa gill symbiont]|uniref:Outer membrane lipid asymmetry maintenance protein MlaD n=2 Tax=Gammaproteobacteria incertae sedis TaxID=118884 RepID=A0A1T2L6Y5_9GAMM|nr:outer membrane lipid asymmetry maintenance protein MlaD [Candidatus Reidiella endopervernicosa]OOZ40867.1 outer membrane lipid asymmetry maintenance protein MlaD [Solemya pervernicosa gill symbiont]QKQ26165.1 outer membrane lipid asymmetry maintenance protein MlaD [Candidatus Reidiella endopervernicosa]